VLEQAAISADSNTRDNSFAAEKDVFMSSPEMEKQIWVGALKSCNIGNKAS